MVAVLMVAWAICAGAPVANAPASTTTSRGTYVYDSVTRQWNDSGRSPEQREWSGDLEPAAAASQGATNRQTPDAISAPAVELPSLLPVNGLTRACPRQPSSQTTLEAGPGLPSRMVSSPPAASVATRAVANEGINVVRNAADEVYVGQSGNITSRLGQHVSTGKFTQAEVDAAQRFEVLGGKTSREIAEQLKLDSLGGRDAPGVLNKVSPIGDRRLNLLPPDYVRP